MTTAYHGCHQLTGCDWPSCPGSAAPAHTSAVRRGPRRHGAQVLTPHAGAHCRRTRCSRCRATLRCTGLLRSAPAPYVMHWHLGCPLTTPSAPNSSS